ncbi:MAG: hypothetical protein ABR915_11425, partial [Thermoguttaceae bacterium]
MNVILENQPRRVLLSREEYESLVKKAKKTPETHAPRAAILVAADYAITTDAQQARYSGTLDIDVLEEGLHALPLDIGGVGLSSARLDDHDAPIGRGPQGPLSLLVEGVGRHRLALEMVGPLETTSAQQVLSFRLPQAAAGRLRLVVPGDVEIKSGAAVAKRTVDQAARATRFELLPRTGDTTILMSLNSHLQRRGQVVAARAVLVDEVTAAYERLHASVTLAVLHRAVDSFQFIVPDGFEMTEITSPLLSRWDVADEAGRKVATVRLREQTTEPVVLSIAAIRAPARLEDWQFPRLEMLDVVSQVTIIGLVAQEHFKAESLVPGDLIPIDASVILRAIPATLLRPDPGAAPVRAVAAYYAPQARYTLTARFVRPEPEMAVTAGVLLVLAEKGCEVQGGLTLLPETEKRFSLDLSVPAGWKVASVTGPDEKPLAMEYYGPADGPGRVRARLPQGIEPGKTCQVRFRAVSSPKGWVGDWKSREIEMPVFAVAGASRDEGAAAVVVQDDLQVRPERLDRLVPLTEPEKARFGLAGVPTNLAYRYEKPGYAATLVVERTRPRITAHTLSFFHVKPEGLSAHYELIYRVDDAKTQRLAFLLPASTPEVLKKLSGLDGVTVEEFTSQPADKGRRWNIVLAEPRRGKIHLAVEFDQSLPSPSGRGAGGEGAGDRGESPRTASGGSGHEGGKSEKSENGIKGFPLPVVRADDVVYQSGNVAIEGSPEFDVEVTTEARRADVGQLAVAEYQPGRRLLGAYAFVGPPPDVAIDVLRHPAYPLVPAIIEKAELLSILSSDGTSQTQADFRLRTKALYLEIELPDGAEIWTVELDNAPLKPQREGGSLLVGLPAAPTEAARTLQLVYAQGSGGARGQGSGDSGESPRTASGGSGDAIISPLPPGEGPASGYPGVSAAALGLAGDIRMSAPKLSFRAARDTEAVALPLVDVTWRLRVPSGYEVVQTGGTLVTADLIRPLPAPVMAAGAAFVMGGGIQPHYGLGCSARECAKSVAKKSAMKPTYYLKDDADYFKPEAKSAEAPPPAAKATEGEVVFHPGAIVYDRGANVVVAPDHVVAAPEVALPEAPPAAETKPEIAAEPPIVYPDADKWKEIAKRKEKYSATELAKRSGDENAAEEHELNQAYLVADLVTPIPGFVARKLGGVRSLKINVELISGDGEKTLTFRSLGEEPVLAVTLARRDRLESLGWALALALGLLGIAVTGRPARQKAALVVIAAVAAAVLPLVWDNVAVAWLSNMVFYAAVLLVPYYFVVALVKWIARKTPRTQSGGFGTAATTTTGILLLAAGILFAAVPVRAGDGKDEDRTPVNVPDDAIILPYDAKSKTGVKDADRMLVPYQRYVELWNRAYPDKKIETRPVAWPYALSGASYSCALEGDESLTVTGHLAIDVFGEGYASVPLGLRGGVLARAELDGKPARLSVVDPASPLPPGEWPGVRAAGSLLLLHVSGKGRHTLDVEVRLRLSRQGGWRLAEGALPAAPASGVAI